MDDPEIKTKKHFRLSPSAAYRWFECPAEPDLRDQAPETFSSYADEGTTAHWVGERALSEVKEPSDFIGQKCPETGMVVTEEYVEPVAQYLAECRQFMDLTDTFNIEEQGTLRAVHPDIGGTTDFWAYHADVKTLYVRDYKHGAGIYVEHERNPQLLIYAGIAVSALLKRLRKHNIEDVIETVDYGIVQPRMRTARPIRTAQVSGFELGEFMYGELRFRAKACDNKEAITNPGKHCHFCPAKAFCPGIAAYATSLAKADFSPTARLPDPINMSVDRLAVIAEAAGLFADWASTARDQLKQRLLRGETHPGFKIVAGKRGDRKWVEGADVTVGRILGAEAYDRKLKSPAQVEKLLKPLGVPIPDGLITQEPGGPCLTSASDPRPALASTNPADDFKAIDTPVELA
jgi:hypothetical protein